jgi:hypothetical protein
VSETILYRTEGSRFSKRSRISSSTSARSALCSRRMAKKRKKKTIWASNAERAAHDAHVDETIRNLRELVAKGRAELAARGER